MKRRHNLDIYKVVIQTIKVNDTNQPLVNTESSLYLFILQCLDLQINDPKCEKVMDPGRIITDSFLSFSNRIHSP